MVRATESSAMTTKKLERLLGNVGYRTKEVGNKLFVEDKLWQTVATVRMDRVMRLDTDFRAELKENAYRWLLEYAETVVELRTQKKYRLFMRNSYITHVEIERTQDCSYEQSAYAVYDSGADGRSIANEMQIKYLTTKYDYNAQTFNKEMAEMIKSYLNVTLVEVQE